MDNLNTTNGNTPICENTEIENTSQAELTSEVTEKREQTFEETMSHLSDVLVETMPFVSYTGTDEATL